MKNKIGNKIKNVLRKNSGVSIVTLIITIVVIIILAAIAIYSGFKTADNANFAKFTSEFSDFNMAATNDYMKKQSENVANNETRTKAQVYYEIASGVDVGMNGVTVPAGEVIEINSRLSDDLIGKEFYIITDDTNISGWESDKHYYDPNENHYVTDEGEVFVLPGYLTVEDGVEKWWVNEQKYYVGEKIEIEGGNIAPDNNKINISGINTTYEYTGSKITPEPIVKSNGKLLVKGTDYTVSYGSNLNIGEGTITVTLKGEFSGTEVIKFTIVAKSINSAVVTLEETEYAYDGDAKEPGVTVKLGSSNLVEGTDFTVEYKNNINAGTASVIIKGKGNYSGTKTETFKIGKQEVVVTASHYTGIYDGSAHTIELNILTPSVGANIYYSVSEELTSENYLSKGTDKKPTRTDVGNTRVYYYVVAPNYNAASGNANILISARDITVKPKDVSKKYDGTALTSNEVVVTSEGLVAGHSVGNVTTIGSQTDVGSSTNEISSVKILDASNKDVTANYNIIKATGTLTVTAQNSATFGITLSQNSYEYDGTAKEPGVTVKVGTKQLTAAEYDVIYTNNVNAGKATVTVKGKGNYAGSTTSVEFTIEKRALTLTAGNGSKVYDGTALTVSDVTPNEGGLASGHVLSVTTTGGQTNVGTIANKVATYEIKSGTEDVTANYNITLVDGTLTVTAKTVTVTAGTTTLNYTGSALKPTVSVSGAVAGEKINLKITTNPTSAIAPGTYSATVTIESVTGGNAIASNYTLTGTTTIEFKILAKIAFNANGGLGTIDNAYKALNSAFELPECSFTNEGYTFIGWSINGGEAKNAGTSIKVTENLEIKAIWRSNNAVNIEDLGDVEVSDPDAEFDYDPGTGDTSGIVPPEEDVPETPPEMPAEELPEIIEFGFGNFESNTKYTPGTYETVPYETTYTKIKYPVSYQGVVWSKWNITKDAEGNILNIVPKEIELADIDKKYSTYILYDFTTEEALEMEGVKGDSVYLHTIYENSDDSLDNIIYLAAYLNKTENNPNRHVAKWDGSKYVAVDYDAEIKAIDTFTEAYTVTGTKQVQVTAPSSSTEYIYVPSGTLKAEKGMTWAKWLASDYNTTGETAPTIKTLDFEDVSYDDVIVAGKNYGFIVYKLSGTWVFPDYIDTPNPEEMHISQAINFTVGDNSFASMVYELSYIDRPIYGWYPYFGYDDYIVSTYGFTDDIFFEPIDFGSTPQPVSKEFYEWFTANATRQVYELSGIWVMNNHNYSSTKCIEFSENIKFTSNGTSYNRLYSAKYDHNATGAYGDGFEIWVYHLQFANDSLDDNVAYFSTNDNAYNFWDNDAYRTIDFGTEPQSVSKEFYEWFTANATSVKYSIVDGTGADGKHYHNDELFTGTCNGVDYENGIEKACFVAGTKILMADGTTKNIEDVQVGDKVISYNRNNDEYYTTTVNQTIEKEVDVYYEIKLEDGTIVKPTGNHPILTDNGFKTIIGITEDAQIIDVLNVGDKVMTIDGYKPIVCIIRYDEKKKVYNLNVVDDDEIESGEDDDSEDTFIVEGVVCHNIITHCGGSNE